MAEEAEISVFVGGGADGGNTRFDLAALEARGVRLIEVKAPIRGLRQQLELPARLRRLEADVFHAPYFLTSYPRACPMVVGIYDTVAAGAPEDLPSKSARFGAKLGLRLATRAARAVITLSQIARRDLVKTLGLDPERVVVTPAAPPPHYAPAAEEAIDELRRRLDLPERYVLHVGTNKPHKNLERLMEAWTEVSAFKDLDCGLIFAGAHDERHYRVAAAARRLGFTGVRGLGAVAEDDLPALYSGAEVFVLPSLSEGFGLPVVEAMACGTPVACSKSGALPEVASHTAVYFDPAEAGTIAAALTRLLASQTYREVLAKRGRARAAQLSWKQTARRTLDAYRLAADG